MKEHLYITTPYLICDHALLSALRIPDQQGIIGQRKACAKVINETDEKMLDIRRQIEAAANVPTEEEIPLDKLSKLDVVMD